MAVDVTKVGVALTGSVYVAPVGTAAPTSQTSSLNAAFVEFGYISEDGVTQTLPVSGDATFIKVWQGGATVRIVRTAPDEFPTFQFTSIETNKTSLEKYYGATLTQTATEGALTVNTTVQRGNFAWVVDLVDGAELERLYVPSGPVIEAGDRAFTNSDAIGYDITLEAQYNAGITGNYKLWTTRGKT